MSEVTTDPKTVVDVKENVGVVSTVGTRQPLMAGQSAPGNPVNALNHERDSKGRLTRAGMVSVIRQGGSFHFPCIVQGQTRKLRTSMPLSSRLTPNRLSSTNRSRDCSASARPRSNPSPTRLPTRSPSQIRNPARRSKKPRVLNTPEEYRSVRSVSPKRPLTAFGVIRGLNHGSRQHQQNPIVRDCSGLW